MLVTGGFAIDAPWVRLRSRDATRPFVLSGLAAAAYLIAYRRHIRADLTTFRAAGLPRRDRWQTLAAAGLALATFAVAVRWGSFVAGGSDASGYVSEAELWLHGQLVRQRPAWTVGAPWPLEWPITPLGYLPGSDPRTFVPTYPPGLPLMMAVFQAMGGRAAVFYVVPVLGAIGVWVTYLLGRRVGGPQTGVIAAALLFASPAYLFMLVQPMADVPAAAMWAMALYLANGERMPHAVLAGLASAVAVLVRPNLLPLAGVVGLLVVMKPQPVPRLLAFAVALAPIGLLGVVNAVLFGSPFRTGYAPFHELYSLDRVGVNLAHYTGWLLASQTPAVLLTLAAPFVWPISRARVERALITLGFPALVLALYLPYYVQEEWWYLRFLLPAYPPLCVAVGGVLVALAGRVRWPALRAWMPWLVVVPVAWHGLRYSREPFGGTQTGDQRYVRMIDYVPRLSRRSVFVSLAHSGTIQYYTGLDVLRWEGLYDPSYLDPAIDYLRQLGFNVYLVADYGEIDGFRQRFAGTRTASELTPAAARDLGNPLVYALGGTTPPPQP